MGPWVLTLLKMVVVPILDKVATLLEQKAAVTPDSGDDILAGSFRIVVDALKSEDIISLLQKK